MQNFNFPYFSRNISEFWRRWHISLNTWFRDYLYIPIGGSRSNKYRTLLNVFIIFIVSGFWHGANWTFIVWGFFHSLLYIPSLLFNTNRKYLIAFKFDKVNFSNIKQIIKILVTYCTVTFTWIFFRSDNIREAFHYIQILIFVSMIIYCIYMLLLYAWRLTSLYLHKKTINIFI